MSTTSTVRKTECPITRTQFAKHAKPVNCRIGDTPIPAFPRTFSTNSIGYYANAKAMIEVDGVMVPCQVAVTITAIGSKDLSTEAPATTPRIAEVA